MCLSDNLLCIIAFKLLADSAEQTPLLTKKTEAVWTAGLEGV